MSVCVCVCLLAAAVACACKSNSLLQLSRHKVPYQNEPCDAEGVERDMLNDYDDVVREVDNSFSKSRNDFHLACQCLMRPMSSDIKIIAKGFDVLKFTVCNRVGL